MLDILFKVASLIYILAIDYKSIVVPAACHSAKPWSNGRESSRKQLQVELGWVETLPWIAKRTRKFLQYTSKRRSPKRKKH